ncbi:MAG: HK97-fold major capsid protein [Halanaerobiales bacterium]
MELPQGALPRYERDVASVAWVVSRRGAVPDQIQEGEEVIVPTFEIAANPTVRLSEIKARRYYIVDRAQIKAKEAIQKEEDTNIFNALLSAAENADGGEGQEVFDEGGNVTPADLNEAFRLVERHDLVVAKIVCHANQYANIRMFGNDLFDEATQRQVITTGLFGHLFTADIHVSSRMPEDYVVVVASPETVGAFPIRQDITVMPADDPKKLRLGWVIYEEVGIVVMNDYAVAKINLSGETS